MHDVPDCQSLPRLHGVPFPMQVRGTLQSREDREDRGAPTVRTPSSLISEFCHLITNCPKIIDMCGSIFSGSCLYGRLQFQREFHLPLNLKMSAGHLFQITPATLLISVKSKTSARALFGDRSSFEMSVHTVRKSICAREDLEVLGLRRGRVVLARGPRRTYCGKVYEDHRHQPLSPSIRKTTILPFLAIKAISSTSIASLSITTPRPPSPTVMR